VTAPSGRRPLAATLAALATVTAVAAACAAGPSSPDAGSAHGSAAARLTGPSTLTISHSTRVTVGGRSVAVPTEIGTTPIAPTLDEGQQVIMAAGGLLPARLYSRPGVAVVWTNLTDQTERVIFDLLPVRSPPIPPGGSFSYTSLSSQSIAYHTSSGQHGVDTVLPPGL
jgi:hypothetical protein